MHYSQSILETAMHHMHSGCREKAMSLLKKYYCHMMLLQKHDTVSFGQHRVTATVQPISDDAPMRPITWEIVDKRGEKLMLVSEYVVDWSGFFGSTWQDSWIRKELNSRYLQAWFKDYERHLLLPNPDDYVFLLSLEEIQAYFQRPFSPYAAMLIEELCTADSGEDYSSLEEMAINYWLRSPGDRPGRFAYVDKDGRVIKEGFRSTADEFGIRPAVWIDLSRIKDFLKLPADE